MRTVFFAAADDAVRLALSLRAGILIGGMDQAIANKMIKRFIRSKHGVLVCTAAFATGWRAPVMANVFFLNGYWGGPSLTAINRVQQPPGCMTADDLLAAMARAGTLNNTLVGLASDLVALPAPEKG